MKIWLSKRESFETDAMSVAELRQMHDYLVGEAQKMAADIRDAERALLLGETVDKGWLGRLRFSKRNTSRAAEELRPILSQRIKQENRIKHPPLSEYFMEICRERMDETLFNQIYQAAIALLNAKKEAERNGG